MGNWDWDLSEGAGVERGRRDAGLTVGDWVLEAAVEGIDANDGCDELDGVADDCD